MPFFNQDEQQRLMAQMFQNPQGGPMPPMGGGQGGIGEGGPMIGPSFSGPEMLGPGGVQDLGVEAPDSFNLPVPNIGDQGMVMQPPNVGDQAMVQGQIPKAPGMGGLGDGGLTPDYLQALGGPDGARQKLIQAIINRQSVY